MICCGGYTTRDRKGSDDDVERSGNGGRKETALLPEIF
jgi:hypothetical protein